MLAFGNPERRDDVASDAHRQPIAVDGHLRCDPLDRLQFARVSGLELLAESSSEHLLGTGAHGEVVLEEFARCRRIEDV